MNFGTPQEMIDEEYDFTKKTHNEKTGGCASTVFFILIIFLIIYALW
jgi:hypothetical protein